MIRRSIFLVAIIFINFSLSESANASNGCPLPKPESVPVVVYPQPEFLPLNLIDHPVSTKNVEAQRFFNNGLTYIFAFNHDLAFREFKKASEIDPELAMAYWGMALAIGQNINQDITPENEKRAYNLAQKALRLSTHATPVEKAYINALVKRYSVDPFRDLIALRYVYRDAMKELVQQYPEDLDAASLYAESILNLDPWRYWTWDGKPREGTMEAIQTLASVLTRNPYHIGANHYYIHAWEESPTPEEALISAFRLTRLLPDAGHLLHMPCHIFILCGYYANAIETSKHAIAADRRYIKEFGMGGEYPLHYLTHNLRILVRAYMLAEDYHSAIRTAYELDQFLTPYYNQMHHLAKNKTVPLEVNLYFHCWEDLLAQNAPAIQSPYVLAFWHFSRAMAFINLRNIDEYHKERRLMQEEVNRIKPEEEIANNPARKIMELADLILDAQDAKFHNNPWGYIETLEQASALQDRLYYDEPPPWYTLVRIELGRALLDQKRFKDAEEVFRKARSELQRNGRILTGLYLSLKGQGRLWDAFWVEREAKAALRKASLQPGMNSL